MPAATIIIENMFCPKCGTENSSPVRFCRTCGEDLETVSALVEGRLVVSGSTGDKGFFRKPSWELAMLSLFLGVAILVTAFILGFDYITGFPTPWLAMLIVAFPMIGYGVAQIIKVSTMAEMIPVQPAAERQGELSGGHRELPESRTDYVSPEDVKDYRTADLVPGSVVEGTTRHLEMEEEPESDDD